MKYALIQEGAVIQTQPNDQDGFIEVPNSVIPGMIDNGDDTFSPPPKTPEQIEQDKWEELRSYLSYLTVYRLATTNPTVAAGFKFDVSPSGVNNITNEINAMTELDSVVWEESWGKQSVTKLELQEALVLRKKAKDLKMVELGLGVI